MTVDPRKPGTKAEEEPSEEELEGSNLVDEDDDEPEVPPAPRLGWNWQPPAPEGIPHKEKD
jgi:hypothetical protein